MQVGSSIPGSDEGSVLVWSQPSGFTSFHRFGIDGGISLESWTHDGQMILAASTANSCGCLGAPGATTAATVGRDGSLIVPHAPEQFGTCRYDLHPQLLK